jgi:SAM-dependent methyltransferase
MFGRSAAYYDELYAFKDYAAEAAQLVSLVEARVPAARTLLDVGCGTGKHLAALRARFDVTGAELDDGLRRIAAERLPGVPLVGADMIALELGRRFDVVCCLFGTIGYARTRANVIRAICAMAKHLAAGGVLVVEPWLAPDVYRTGVPHLLVVDRPERKIVRANTSARDGDVSILDFHYLVATPEGVQSFRERHELVMLDDAQYRQAFAAAGLVVEHDAAGLNGRGLYIARAS